MRRMLRQDHPPSPETDSADLLAANRHLRRVIQLKDQEIYALQVEIGKLKDRIRQLNSTQRTSRHFIIQKEQQNKTYCLSFRNQLSPQTRSPTTLTTAQSRNSVTPNTVFELSQNASNVRQTIGEVIELNQKPNRVNFRSKLNEKQKPLTRRMQTILNSQFNLLSQIKNFRNFQNDFAKNYETHPHYLKLQENFIQEELLHKSVIWCMSLPVPLAKIIQNIYSMLTHFTKQNFQINLIDHEKSLKETLKQVFECENCNLIVVDSFFNKLKFIHEGQIVIRPLKTGIIGNVIENKEILALVDTSSHPSFVKSVDDIQNINVYSSLYLPVRNEIGQVKGLIQLINKKQRPFSFSVLDKVQWKWLQQVMLEIFQSLEKQLSGESFLDRSIKVICSLTAFCSSISLIKGVQDFICQYFIVPKARLLIFAQGQIELLNFERNSIEKHNFSGLAARMIEEKPLNLQHPQLETDYNELIDIKTSMPLTVLPIKHNERVKGALQIINFSQQERRLSKFKAKQIGKSLNCLLTTFYNSFQLIKAVQQQVGFISRHSFRSVQNLSIGSLQSPCHESQDVSSLCKEQVCVMEQSSMQVSLRDFVQMRLNCQSPSLVCEKHQSELEF